MDNNSSNKIIYFSYSKRDVLLIFLLYAISCFVFIALVNGDLKGCILAAFAVALVTSFFVTLMHMLEILYSEIKQLKQERESFQKNIREEYQKIYRLRRKHELISRAISMESESEENVILDVEDPRIGLNNGNGNSSSVHINYLNKFGNKAQNAQKKGRSPQG
ncbi:MAG: hypothetical protein A3B68_06330 [Candidatus Melainabacteria bacterium RIFCSPHIGHO2_02_FULL_34_12]|nr:MAG: hypothetical protein A3B68_06330 [Candidatus Melainabacteria bacterium RIFCSPHIGHO2_02_FULL_34_12]